MKTEYRFDFVSRALPVPMIGIERRIDELTELGLEHTFADFRDHDGILAALGACPISPIVARDSPTGSEAQDRVH